jgi:predicted O-linked N-acetylglucosamine transferase (SPINDLY family)
MRFLSGGFPVSHAHAQMSYMGFCASSGADYMNHLVADRVVAPPDLR